MLVVVLASTITARMPVSSQQPRLQNDMHLLCSYLEDFSSLPLSRQMLNKNYGNLYSKLMAKINNYCMEPPPKEEINWVRYH